MKLIHDWKWVVRHACSVRVLAFLAFLDFLSAGLLLVIDGAASSLIADHTTAVILALVVKSLLSVGGIVLRVKVQHEAKELVEDEA